MYATAVAEGVNNEAVLIALGLIASAPAFVAAIASVRHRRETRTDHDVVQVELIAMKGSVDDIKNNMNDVKIDVAVTREMVAENQRGLAHADVRLARLEEGQTKIRQSG